MSGDAFQQILMFLAGLGFGPLVQNIEKLRGPRQAKGKGGPQAPGPGASPLGPGGGGLPPQIAQLLAQRAALQRLSPQGPPGPGLGPGMLPPGM